MKKVLAFLAAGLILLTACGPEDQPLNGNGLPDLDKTQPYYVNMIGGPEYQGWFNFLKDLRANAKQGSDDVFIYHEVDSGLDAKELVQELVNKKVDGYVNLIFVGLGPYDYTGGSQEAAKENFNKLKTYVKSLIDLTLNKGFVLLIANGYPRTAEETDEFLLWNHEQMRQFLANQMYANFRVYNFTMKRALGSNETGIIKDQTDEQRNTQLTNALKTYLSLIKKHI